MSTGAEKARLAVVGLLVVGALAAFYLLAGQGPVAQWGSLIAGLVLAAVVFFTAEAGKRLIAFGRDAWREARKVVWPARQETFQMTAVVFGFLAVAGLFFWLLDLFLAWATKMLTGQGG